MKSATLTLAPQSNSPTIHPNIYGQFAEHLGHCIYGGIWVGEDSPIPNLRGIRTDVVNALKAIRVPVIRWPGGCFADEYHWKDGIGPRQDRPSIYNSHWGGVVENNHFGTHEFFELCDQVGCAAYVCGNVGSGTVREMQEWVEYITSPADSPMANLRRQNGREEPWRLPYFGVGNESWGCGGHMRPEYYADLYRQYNTYVRTYGPNKIERIACGPNTADFHWTETLMERVTSHHMDGLALHYYTLLDQKWPPSGSALEFDETEFRSTLKAALHMETLIQKHSEIMDRFDPEKKVNLVVDEWGTWHPSEPGTNPGFLFQQNTLRDALVASIHFDLFHRQAARVRMANIAQMVNVLQTLLFTEGDQMVKTPTYHVFDLYAPHQGAQFTPTELTAEPWGDLPSLSATASQTENTLTISTSCLDPHQGRQIALQNLPPNAKLQRARILTGDSMQSHNSFAQPKTLEPKPLEITQNHEFELPPLAIATLEYSTQ